MASRKTYSELMKLPTYYERLEYLRCHGVIGGETFGNDRYFNQTFYQSPEWKRVRRDCISRDNGRDLGIEGLEIKGRLYVHHLNPISLEDIVNGDPALIDPENLICCSYETHKEIHYGSKKSHEEYHERTPNDTCPWKRIEV